MLLRGYGQTILPHNIIKYNIDRIRNNWVTEKLTIIIYQWDNSKKGVEVTPYFTSLEDSKVPNLPT